MILKSLEIQEKVFDCYDFTMLRGIVLPLTLDPEAGDTVELGPDRIVIHMCERPSISNAKTLLPQEDWVIERRNLLFYQHRTMKVQEQTAEQRQEWKAALEKASSTVN